MKNILRLSIISGFLLLQSCTNSVNSTSNSITSSLIASKPTTNSVSGSDKYEIHWSGRKGKELHGGYAILSEEPDAPMKMESVQAKLPHKISFSAPTNSVVSASGNTLNGGTVEVKIYKNGSECGKVAVVGSQVGANKVCQ